MIVRVYFLSVQVTRILADSVNWRRNWYIVKFTTTRMGFKPTRAEHNGLAVHRLNHSATSSFSERSLSPESQTVPVLKTVVTMVTSGCGHKKKKKKLLLEKQDSNPCVQTTVGYHFFTGEQFRGLQDSGIVPAYIGNWTCLCFLKM